MDDPPFMRYRNHTSINAAIGCATVEKYNTTASWNQTTRDNICYLSSINYNNSEVVNEVLVQLATNISNTKLFQHKVFIQCVKIVSKMQR